MCTHTVKSLRNGRENGGASPLLQGASMAISHPPLCLPESILRRLPPGLSATQLVALDVVSHARDITSLSGQRLTQTLTDIAIGKSADSIQIASAFADAWSVVDAVDRIRSMVRLLAKHLHESFKPVTTAFDEETKVIRELRNLTDHLPQRIEGVLASNMPAIGRLSWVTVISTESALFCALDPGTVRSTKKAITLPDVGGRSVVLPTSAVLLSAGSTKAWLDEASLAVHKLVAALESYLEKLVSENNLSGVEAGRNFLAVGEISFPEQIAVPLDAQQGSLF